MKDIITTHAQPEKSIKRLEQIRSIDFQKLIGFLNQQIIGYQLNMNQSNKNPMNDWPNKVQVGIVLPKAKPISQIPAIHIQTQSDTILKVQL
jgi:hypothetical protein